MLCLPMFIFTFFFIYFYFYINLLYHKKSLVHKDRLEYCIENYTTAAWVYYTLENSCTAYTPYNTYKKNICAEFLLWPLSKHNEILSLCILQLLRDTCLHIVIWDELLSDHLLRTWSIILKLFGPSQKMNRLDWMTFLLPNINMDGSEVYKEHLVFVYLSTCLKDVKKETSAFADNLSQKHILHVAFAAWCIFN